MTFYDELLAALEDARHSHPHQAADLDLQAALLLAASELHASLQLLASGAASLSPDEVAMDGDQWMAFQRQVCQIIAKHRPELVEELAPLLTRPLWLSSHSPEGHQVAPSDLESYVRRQTMYPFLRAHVDALDDTMNSLDSTAWRCPNCGDKPDMAALTKPNGERVLLCRACDTEWHCPRLGCPFCSNEDTAKLAYYLGDDEAYRLYVCESCRRYLKTVDLRRQSKMWPLPVERILTSAMDVAAQEAGYHQQAGR